MDRLVLIVIPALWAKAVFASPYLTTQRHGLSAALACVASLFLFASLHSDKTAFPVIFGAACIITAAAFAALLLRPKPKGGVR
jgi:hypothetical protein